VTKVLVAVAVALALAPSILAARQQSSASPPPPGNVKSLLGVKVGDTAKRVRQLWGSSFKPCPTRFCRLTTWIYLYSRGEPLGVGLRFQDGRVVAIFRLGTAPGYKP
jgi:hypothetical protein